MGQQLPLIFAWREDATLENFHGQDNAPLKETLQQCLQELRQGQCLYCYAKAPLGKTHVLAAACNFAAQLGLRAMYLPLDAEVAAADPADVFANIELVDLVCLDNLEAVLGHRVWEEALFNLYNRSLPRHTCLLFSATMPPSMLVTLLPDLKTRLAASLVFPLAVLQDHEKIQLLIERAAVRGLLLEAKLAEYLLTHVSRDLAVLLDVLAQLDAAAAVAKRRLTLPFIKQVLGI